MNKVVKFQIQRNERETGDQQTPRKPNTVAVLQPFRKQRHVLGQMWWQIQTHVRKQYPVPRLMILALFLYSFCLFCTGNKNLVDRNIIICQSFAAIFLTVLSALNAFKHLSVSYNNLNGRERQQPQQWHLFAAYEWTEWLSPSWTAVKMMVRPHVGFHMQLCSYCLYIDLKLSNFYVCRHDVNWEREWTKKYIFSISEMRQVNKQLDYYFIQEPKKMAF